MAPILLVGTLSLHNSPAVLCLSLIIFLDASLTDDFWQYAVVKQEAVAGLKHLKNYKVYFPNVKEHDGLSKEQYAQGQYGNSGFDSLVEELTSESKC